MLRPVPGLVLSDRFTLERELGHGGMGSVWLAEDRQRSERVVLKILDRQIMSSADSVELLREECRKASRLSHPNIVRVYDFHETDDASFISMQYIDGTTLGHRSPMPFPEVVVCALSLCDAIEHAHRCGIVHRDIKPANVLCDSSGHYYLTDFGVSSSLFEESQPIRMRGGGSLPSMSPQQLAGEPAAVSDDIYGLGALIYELLTGAPLFHPEPTAQRIRHEPPPAPDIDQTGRRIPGALSALVLAMLDKHSARRPAGVAAVRSVLNEIRADYPPADDETVIQPRSRPGSAGDTVEMTPRKIQSQRQGLPPGVVMAAFGVLIALVLGVVFLLPKVVEERGALIQQPEPERVEQQDAGTDTLPPDPAVIAALRARADEVLGELLAVEERLHSIGIENWGGNDWLEAERLAEAGNAAYRERDYEKAVSEHRQALDRMNLLEARAPEAFARALEDGEQALRAQDQNAAIGRFELALQIQPLQQDAQRGLQRALRLDRVLALMQQGAEAERAEDWSAAESFYRQALELDEAWQPASTALERVAEVVDRIAFETQMAAGFGAVQRQDYERARQAFRAALKIRPGDAAAIEALRQVDADQELGQVVALKLSARNAEAEERWADAVRDYSEILEIDPKIASVGADLQRARERVRLAADLDGVIGNADRFYEDRVVQQASGVLARARSIPNPGPQLTGKIEQLDRLLRVAAKPVRVRFESDNLTDVVIYKVGRLGVFSARTIELKPGVYVAVGTREGYRDVRRSFRVVAGGAMPPVILTCEEPI